MFALLTAYCFLPTAGLTHPGGEMDIMAPSEGAGPGSIPGRGTGLGSSGCDGLAHDPAKVEDEVRLLTGIFLLGAFRREP